MSKSVTFRLPDEVFTHLDEMANICGRDRTNFLISLIEQEYDRYQGSPKMKKALEALRQCQEIIRSAGMIEDYKEFKIVLEKEPEDKKPPDLVPRRAGRKKKAE